ncbi:helix-turn-helix domain-containing protein [Enterococcus crotali]|uniref:helix-turn-helix domain-containing protein n=1 Tax=Enterococcus crotali TaxID=1453587 RepID=UPI0004711D3E|nr:helix-turn-helix domain-containing protein [Enterococcus crotali]
MEPFFILALFQHGYKARTSTLYHLLKGKRTSSVLLYGFLYENLQFFQLFPTLTEVEFRSIITGLIKQKLLQQTADGEAQITAKGQQAISQYRDRFSRINNYHFGKTDEMIWRLLQFTVQVVSHLSYTNKNYIPLEQSPLYQRQVKMYLKSMPKAQLIKTTKREWTQIFAELSKEEANYFTRQFSGYQQIGKTSFQLMDVQRNAFDRFLFSKEKLHYLLYTIEQMPEGSFLRALILPLIKQNENKSMNETKVYLKRLHSVDKLAEQRKVKISTIKDHLMELALTDDVPFDSFITKKTSDFLLEFSKPYQDWSYRSLKQLNPELDYFEFRLYQIQKLREEREASQ